MQAAVSNQTMDIARIALSKILFMYSQQQIQKSSNTSSRNLKRYGSLLWIVAFLNVTTNDAIGS